MFRTHLKLGLTRTRTLLLIPFAMCEALPCTQCEFDMAYKDDISISLSTAYLFNYPMVGFARLPVSVTISLSVFACRVSLPCILLVFPSQSFAGGHQPPFSLLSCSSSHIYHASEFHAGLEVDISLRESRKISRRP